MEWERTAFLAHLIQIGQAKKPKTVQQILKLIGKDHLVSEKKKTERDIKADRRYLQDLVQRMKKNG